MPFKVRRKEYEAWIAMKQRCFNKDNPSYRNYGGRGITVCDRWCGEGGYDRFIEDMGECPSGMSLERVDNNRGYSPENCCWADRKSQQRNRRVNNCFTIDGVTRCLTEWAEIYAINKETVRKRLRLGWDIEKALSVKARIGRNRYSSLENPS